MSAKEKGKKTADGKKTKGGKKRIPGKVILPVAVFAVAAAISAVVVSFVIGGDKPTDPTAAIALHAPAASLVMPPPLAAPVAPTHVPPSQSDTAHTAPGGTAAPNEGHSTVVALGSEAQPQAHNAVPEPAKDLASTLPQNDTPAAAVPAAAVPGDTALTKTLAGDATPSTPPAPQQLANLTGGPATLPSHADPDLVERTPQGFLPRVGPDGRQPWQVYARPFDATDDRPRLAVVLTSLGLSSAATEAAIQGLPGGITLAFQPYAEDLQQWIRLARAAGHEVMLNLPMEPVDYPSSDPGPQALFTALTPQQNLTRLDWALSRVTGYVGVTNFMGSRFTTSRDAMLPVVQTLKDRGLLLLDSRASARSVAATLATELAVPRAINDRFLDTGEVTRVSIDSRLAEAERIALEVGTSVVIGQPYPVTIERLRAWALELESRGIALAPLSAVVDLQEDR